MATCLQMWMDFKHLFKQRRTAREEPINSLGIAADLQAFATRRLWCAARGAVRGRGLVACACKNSERFPVLILGRVFGGIATSLLYSAFEAWVGCELNVNGP